MPRQRAFPFLADTLQNLRGQSAILKALRLGFAGLWMFAVSAPIPCAAADFLSDLVQFKHVEINGRPAHMVLITSISGTGLLQPGAKRLRLKSDVPWVEASGLSLKISEPANVESGGQDLTAPLLIARLPWLLRLAASLITVPIDGVVGWPEVRDNILVFDSTRRTIRRVEQLPPETAGWLKLKVVPDDVLLLELPLTNGEVGTLAVGTVERKSAAVMLSPEPWKEWKAAHPHPGRASEITLGPITLTDVAVKEMPADDARGLLDETPLSQSAWLLGLSALERLDLVVDGKNGWAYLHPKPPPASPKKKTDDSATKWTVETNVPVSSDNLFVYSAFYKWYKSDFAGALADCNHALALNPRNFDAYSQRGTVREVMGDFADAVSNYDKVIELKPDNSGWERLYRQALLWRLDQPGTNSKSAAKANEPGSVIVLDPVIVSAVRPKGMAGSKQRWVQTLGMYLNGKLDEKELLTMAKKSDGEMAASEQKALAYYYIAMVRLRQGDQAAACDWFRKCRSAGIKDDEEYFFAVAELARLGAAAR